MAFHLQPASSRFLVPQSTTSQPSFFPKKVFIFEPWQSLAFKGPFIVVKDYTYAFSVEKILQEFIQIHEEKETLVYPASPSFESFFTRGLYMRTTK